MSSSDLKENLKAKNDSETIIEHDTEKAAIESLPGGHTEPNDLNLVTWDGPDDPMNPINWSKHRRWTLIALVTTVVFVAGLSSSIFAPGVPVLMKEFGSTNQALGIFVVSIYVLGLGTGPIVFAPLSELYGRLPIQHIGNLGFIVFTIACAVSTNLGMLIGFRLLQGMFAAVPLTNGGGVIADTVRQEERGFALACFTFGLLAGPCVGPVIGGFLAAATSWRWAFWLTAILVSNAPKRVDHALKATAFIADDNFCANLAGNLPSDPPRTKSIAVAKRDGKPIFENKI